ncbi:HTH-type transcriptional activator Btr [Acaryochloris thomasi RCC1774]|uniref:HTH-type transcriptional activator Btr n=1 Tax=Acaryochloris thomasi RCC1774 TaxID=1764569 RepID=A0A2W1K6E3_9CYAN|nr:helix-turn-helix domain-containing protein [Acaryochloris thomasi]PZD75197.1 HTH-type transcriptional activator Btr [Acaryochloris thomasi RCC1774]
MTDTPPPQSSETYEFDGYSIFYCAAAPTDWPQECHEQVEILVPFGRTVANLTWQEAQDQQQEMLCPEQVCIIPAQQSHALQLAEPSELMQIFLDPQFIVRTTHEVLRSPHWSLTGHYALEDETIRSVAQMLRPWLTERCSVSNLYRTMLVKLLAVHLIAKYAQADIVPIGSEGGVAISKLAPVLNHIHRCIDENLKIADLADIYGVSPSHFSRVFKDAVGQSPHQYILSQRINLAKQLLAETDLSIADITLECGFYDQSHFIVQFRRFTGTTPKTYRNKCSIPPLSVHSVGIPPQLHSQWV